MLQHSVWTHSHSPQKVKVPKVERKANFDVSTVLRRQSAFDLFRYDWYKSEMAAGRACPVSALRVRLAVKEAFAQLDADEQARYQEAAALSQGISKANRLLRRGQPPAKAIVATEESSALCLPCLTPPLNLLALVHDPAAGATPEELLPSMLQSTGDNKHRCPLAPEALQAFFADSSSVKSSMTDRAADFAAEVGAIAEGHEQFPEEVTYPTCCGILCESRASAVMLKALHTVQASLQSLASVWSTPAQLANEDVLLVFELLSARVGSASSDDVGPQTCCFAWLPVVNMPAGKREAHLTFVMMEEAVPDFKADPGRHHDNGYSGIELVFTHEPFCEPSDELKSPLDRQSIGMFRHLTHEELAYHLLKNVQHRPAPHSAVDMHTLVFLMSSRF